MKNEFLFQDLYLKNNKSIIKSVVVPLSCYVCKKELNGISLTAKKVNGKIVFLCSRHYQRMQYPKEQDFVEFGTLTQNYKEKIKEMF